MKFNKIIIDGNNLWHRNYHIVKKLLKDKDQDKLVYQTIEFFLNSVKKLQVKFSSNFCEYYFLWDNAKSKLTVRSQMDDQILNRKEIDSEYKENRIVYDQSFYNGIDYLRLLLQNRYNYYYDLRIDKYEADDVVKSLIDYFQERKEVGNFLIVSEDMDWSRCLEGSDFSYNIFWYSKDKVWEKELFKHHYGFYPTPENIIMYKTFKGDKSDNIPIPIKNLKDEIIIRIINEYSNIYTFLANVNKLDYISNGFKIKILDNRKRLILNYQLVNFINIHTSAISENLIQGKRDIEVLKRLYKMYGNIDIYKYEKMDEGFINKGNINPENFFIRRSSVNRL